MYGYHLTVLKKNLKVNQVQNTSFQQTLREKRLDFLLMVLHIRFPFREKIKLLGSEWAFLLWVEMIETYFCDCPWAFLSKTEMIRFSLQGPVSGWGRLSSPRWAPFVYYSSKLCKLLQSLILSYLKCHSSNQMDTALSETSR